MILITTVLSCTNSLSRTSFDFSLKTSFVYSNLFSLAKTGVKARKENLNFGLCVHVHFKTSEMVISRRRLAENGEKNVQK